MPSQVALVDQNRLRVGMVSCGYCYLRFSSHRDALAAARVLTGVELTPGVVVDIGWADARDWNKSAPRLPAYF